MKRTSGVESSPLSGEELADERSERQGLELVATARERASLRHICWNTRTTSGYISISDELYRMLERETGDRSFSEVIEAHVQSRGTLADATDRAISGEASLEAAVGTG